MGIFMGMIKTDSLKITAEILSLIAEIDEFKGAWRAIGQIHPEKLTSLKHVATIESIASSTRIEGSKLSDKEVELLLNNLEIKQFNSRDEQEVAGYAEVMNLIFENYNDILLSENFIKQFHRDLLKYSDKDEWHKGEYKKSPNNVEAFDTNGKSLGIVFETASPFDTPFQMEELVLWATDSFENQKLHPLLITAIFIVSFLAIHPFQDGNGRLSRILTSYFLLKSGYVYVPYSSLEAIIENSKESYYLALRKTQGTLKTSEANWQPWILFFLKSLKKQKEQLEIKIEHENILSGRLPALALKILELTSSRGRITISEIVALTKANRNTIKKQLQILASEKHLVKNGIGKGTWYSL